jgi:NAD(P)-dependent dehydrogenase (short-subunit alcohol dehydrogenase family)
MATAPSRHNPGVRSLPPEPARIAWITGASSGIGRALALGLAKRGWTVVATARRAALLDELAADAAALPGHVVPAPGDVTDAARMQSIVAETEAAGPIALAILNAGISQATPAEAFDTEAFRTVLDTNLMGVVNGLGAIVPAMVGRGDGRIAVVASIAGFGGLPGWAAYGAGKAALINLASSLRMDLGPRGVVVQLVTPGFVRTAMTDGAELHRPLILPVEAAAERILRGLDTGRFEITFPRRLSWLLKAVNLLPYPLYHRLARAAAAREPH